LVTLTNFLMLLMN